MHDASVFEAPLARLQEVATVTEQAFNIVRWRPADVEEYLNRLKNRPPRRSLQQS